MRSSEFTVGGLVIWRPEDLEATLYLQTAQIVAEAVKSHPGIIPSTSESCMIDLPQFMAFTSILLRRYSESENPCFRGLVEGVLCCNLAILVGLGRGFHLNPQNEKMADLASKTSNYLEEMRSSLA
jgi:hypothetical protein